MKQSPKHKPENETPSDIKGDSQLSLADQLFYNIVNPKGRSGSETKVIAASGNVINIRVETLQQVTEILKSLKEDTEKRTLPPPPIIAETAEVRNWFENELSSDEEKLFAFTLSIFSGIPYVTFISIYKTILVNLDLSEGKENKQPNLFKKDDILLNTAKAKIFHDEENGETIAFKKDYYSYILFDILCQDYSRLLYEILSTLKKIVEEFNNWEIRSRTAWAIAKVAQINFSYVRDGILTPWANHQEPQVRATASYILAILFNENQHRQAVTRFIDYWSSQKGWRYRWTAASSLKYIDTEIEHESTIKWIGDNLKSLAKFDDIRVADAVIGTILVLYQKHPTETLHFLKEWLQGKQSTEYDDEFTTSITIAVLAFIAIASIEPNLPESNHNKSSILSLIQKDEKNHGEIWELAVLSGIRAFEIKLYESFWDLLVSWIENASNDVDLQDTLGNLIAEIFLNVQPRYKERILNEIRKWERSKDNYLENFSTSTYSLLKHKVNNSETHAAQTPNIQGSVSSIILTSSTEHRLTPEYLLTTVSPFINAIAEIQRVVNDIKGHEFSDVYITSITQNSPIGVSLDGVSDVLRLIVEIFDKGKRDRSKRMEEHLLVEKRLELEKKRLELQEMNIHLAKEGEELKKLKLENLKTQLAIESEIAQASVNVIERVAPQLSESERMIYIGRLLKPVGVLMTSDLNIAVKE